MGLGQYFLGEKYVWVGGLTVTLTLALVQTYGVGFGFGLGPN